MRLAIILFAISAIAPLPAVAAQACEVVGGRIVCPDPPGRGGGGTTTRTPSPGSDLKKDLQDLSPDDLREIGEALIRISKE